MLLLAVTAGCATSNGIVLIDPQGETRRVTSEEVYEMSGGGGGPYLLQVGDEVDIEFTLRQLREGETPWDYRIEVGDTMEVRLSYAPPDRRSTYRIDVGDLIGVSFLKNWTLNGVRTVRPDGMITLEEIGDVEAAGLTTDELRDRLVRLYEESGIIEGEVLISVNVDFSNLDRLESMSRDVVVRPDGKIRLPMLPDDVLMAGLTVNEAAEAIEQAAAGVLENPPHASLMLFPAVNEALAEMNGRVTVRPDGQVSVPHLGDVQAAGYSAEELRMRLAKACGDVIYNDVTPHVSAATMTGARVYVGGEVAVPGVYPLRATPTALQAIMLARGELDTGWLEEVTVIRRNPQGKPYVFRTNLKAAIEQGYTDNDIPLRAFDLVYVPKSPIAKADLFVKQYIDDLVPFSNSLGVSGVYYLNTQDVDTESRSRNLNLGVTAAPVVAP